MSAVGFSLTYHSEKTPIFLGYGSDGLAYGHFSLDFDKAFREHRIPVRIFERVLPIYAVHLMVKAQGVKLVPEEMIMPEENVGFHHKVLEGYMLYNLLVFIASVFLWMVVTEKLNLGIAATLVSMALLFVNFANIKQYFYEPVMIDPTIFLGGMVLAFGIVFRSYILVCVLTFFCLFINAAAVYYCLAAVVFPFKPAPALETPRANNKLYFYLLVSAITLFISGLAVYYFLNPLCAEGTLQGPYIPTAKNWFPLSLLIIALYVFAGFRPVVDRLLQADWMRSLNTIRWKELAILILIVLVVKYLANKYGAHIADLICDNKRETVWTYFIWSLRLGYDRPAAMLSGYFAWFGVAIVVVVFYWRNIVVEGSRYGLGVLVVLSITVLHSLTSDSRHLIFIFPLLITLLCSAFRNAEFSVFTVTAIVLVCIAASKVWFTINPINAEDYGFTPELEKMLYTPLQKYFMNLGPWMNTRMYLLHLFLFGAGFIIYYLVIRYKPKPFFSDTGSRQA